MRTTTARRAIRNAAATTAPHKEVRRRPSVEQRIAFCEARKQGRTIIDACGIAGISRQSGSRWERQRRMVAEGNKSLDPLGPHLSRGEAIGLVSSDIRDGDWRTRQSMVPTLAALQGWNAPSKSEVTHRVVHATTEDWIRADEPVALNAAPSHNQITGNGAPQALLSQGLQPDDAGLHNRSYRTLPHGGTDPTPRSPNGEAIEFIESATQNSEKSRGTE